jgi:hypothetical protein
LRQYYVASHPKQHSTEKSRKQSLRDSEMWNIIAKKLQEMENFVPNQPVLSVSTKTKVMLITIISASFIEETF